MDEGREARPLHGQMDGKCILCPPAACVQCSCRHRVCLCGDYATDMMGWTYLGRSASKYWLSQSILTCISFLFFPLSLFLAPSRRRQTPLNPVVVSTSHLHIIPGSNQDQPNPLPPTTPVCKPPNGGRLTSRRETSLATPTTPPHLCPRSKKPWQSFQAIQASCCRPSCRVWPLRQPSSQPDRFLRVRVPPSMAAVRASCGRLSRPLR